MAWTLCTSSAAVIKAGANVNADIQISGAHLEQWSNEAEGWIVAETRRNWVTKFSTLDIAIKNVLSDVCSSRIAKQMINYDMSGYTSRAEATLMQNIQDDVVTKGLKFLEDFKSNTIKTP